MVLESRCRGFLDLESRCRGFLSSEKMPWDHDVATYLSPFLDVMVFWPWNLDVMVFWSWNLDVVVYVPPRSRFRYHRENKKSRIIVSIMLLKNISVVQIYATFICIMMHKRIRIINRIL